MSTIRSNGQVVRSPPRGGGTILSTGKQLEPLPSRTPAVSLETMRAACQDGTAGRGGVFPDRSPHPTPPTEEQLACRFAVFCFYELLLQKGVGRNHLLRRNPDDPQQVRRLANPGPFPLVALDVDNGGIEPTVFISVEDTYVRLCLVDGLLRSGVLALGKQSEVEEAIEESRELSRVPLILTLERSALEEAWRSSPEQTRLVRSPSSSVLASQRFR